MANSNATQQVLRSRGYTPSLQLQGMPTSPEIGESSRLREVYFPGINEKSPLRQMPKRAFFTGTESVGAMDAPAEAASLEGFHLEYAYPSNEATLWDQSHGNRNSGASQLAGPSWVVSGTGTAYSPESHVEHFPHVLRVRLPSRYANQVRAYQAV